MSQGNSAEMAMNDLRGDLKAVMRDTDALLRATAEIGSERVQDLRAKTQTTMQKVRTVLGEDGLKGYARDTARRTDAYVHEHPWGLIGAAAGTALLVGLLARRH